MKLLFDASALLNLIRTLGSEAYRYLKGSYILTLTPYEVGNALWKKAVLLNRISIGEALSLLDYIDRVYGLLGIVTPRNQSLILRIACTIKATYYDSAYIVAAIENNLALVTDDNKLIRGTTMYREKLYEILGRKPKLLTTRDLLGSQKV